MKVEAASEIYTTTNVNLRKDTSTKHKIITTISKGKQVTHVSKSGSWYKVKYGKKTGFISSKYVKEVSPKKQSASKKYKTTANVNLRKGASTKHKKIMTVPKGKQVTYVSKTGSWYKVKYGKKTGYISSKYLKEVSPKKQSTSKKYKTTANVNLRKGASTKYKKIMTVPKGKQVTYVSKSGPWYKVKYGKKTGFISSKYVTEVSSKKQQTPETLKKPTYIKGVLLANKHYPLPATFAPGENKEARTAFNKMKKTAKKEKLDLIAFSTYRSYEYQVQLYNRYVERDGKAAADRYSARPGYSEHQTGLAFDIGDNKQSHLYFEESSATKWLAKHAHNYGFILRYPKGKEKITGYMYEPWHFRYVGTKLAKEMKKSGKTLEEYLNIHKK